jgi:hypothetical protein
LLGQGSIFAIVALLPQARSWLGTEGQSTKSPQVTLVLRREYLIGSGEPIVVAGERPWSVALLRRSRISVPPNLRPQGTRFTPLRRRPLGGFWVEGS